MKLTYAVRMTLGLPVLTDGGRLVRECGPTGGAAAHRVP